MKVIPPAKTPTTVKASSLEPGDLYILPAHHREVHIVASPKHRHAGTYGVIIASPTPEDIGFLRSFDHDVIQVFGTLTLSYTKEAC